MIVFSILEPHKHELHTGETAPGVGPGTGVAASSAGSDKEFDVAKEGGGLNAIAVCLFIGAISSVGASYATRSLKNMR